MTDEDEMLRFLGFSSVEELFADIPRKVRTTGINLPDGKPEKEVLRELQLILSKNKTTEETLSFLGAGAYSHFIPSCVDAIISRSEFYSSYTPYQAELSQGILQALFEYQSMICELTGMDVANTSMYDAGSSLGEAALMCARISRKSEFLMPRATHWEKKQVLQNYCKGSGVRIREIDFEDESGKLDLNQVAEAISSETAGIYVESPNLFGVLEDRYDEVRDVCESILLVVGVNPLALALMKPPSEMDADIVIGEGQILGNPLNFGGPLLGIFSCKKEHLRKMPGRIIGATSDREGRRAFCMTLQTREQHIRREKATSNICSNESLCAVASAVYVASLGKTGLQRVARENYLNAWSLAKRLNDFDWIEAPIFGGEHFNEFVLRTETDYGRLLDFLLAKGIIGGYPLSRDFPELGEASLWATTEVHAKKDHEKLLKTLREFS